MENPVPFSSAERLIRRLKDVSSCSIQTDEAGEILAVHVTALAGRSPKQIARDIEAILAAEEGVQLDHRKISIAQFGEAELPAERAVLGRLAVAGVSRHEAGGAFEAEVTLSAGSLHATGRAVGSATSFDRRRVLARATLDAISRLVRDDPGLTLAELEEQALGPRRLLVVRVTRGHAGGEASLVGCCEIGYDPTRAVIHAVLDAVNRLVGTLPPREPVEYRIGPAPTP